MTPTAAPRRPPNFASRPMKNGQVATTIIVAQSSALRNGCSTQRLPPMSRAKPRTESVMRVRSRDKGGAEVATRTLCAIELPWGYWALGHAPAWASALCFPLPGEGQHARHASDPPGHRHRDRAIELVP